MEDSDNRAIWEILRDLETKREDLLPEWWLENLSTYLTDQDWFDGGYEISFDPTSPPLLLCFFSFSAFRRYFRNKLIFTEAFQVVCHRNQVDFEDMGRREWDRLQSERPDLVVAAHRLSDDHKFVIPLIERIKVRIDV